MGLRWGGGKRRARRQGERAASWQGRQLGKGSMAGGGGKGGKSARAARPVPAARAASPAAAARAASPAAAATSSLASVASPAVKRGGGKDGKAVDAGALPGGACGLPGSAAVTAGGAEDLPCGYVREEEGFAFKYQHG